LKWIQGFDFYTFLGEDEDIKTKITTLLKKEHPEMNIDFIESAIFELEPSNKRLRKMISIKSKINLENLVVLSSRPPTQTYFKEYHPFVFIQLNGEHFPYTREELALNISKDKIIKEKLGLTILSTNKTLKKDMAGADWLMKDTLEMLELETYSLDSFSGLFFFGTAGAGKTHFAEALAGTTGRRLVLFDLPYFMSLPNPTKTIDDIFNFLQEQDEKYLLLIDEIEKMFEFGGGSGSLVAKNVFGKLLTRLNMIYGDVNNKITFVATANNITDIMVNSPEFLRRGRFNRLYFLDYPDEEGSKSIFELYKMKNKDRVERMMQTNYTKYKNGNSQEIKKLIPYFNEVSKGTYSLEELSQFFYIDFSIFSIYTFIESKYGKHKVSDADKFVYSPPEIRAVSEELQNQAFLRVLDENQEYEKLVPEMGSKRFQTDDKFVLEVIGSIVPLQISARDGISKQISQSKTYLGKDSASVQQFTTSSSK